HSYRRTPAGRVPPAESSSTPQRHLGAPAVQDGDMRAPPLRCWDHLLSYAATCRLDTRLTVPAPPLAEAAGALSEREKRARAGTLPGRTYAVPIEEFDDCRAGVRS